MNRCKDCSYFDVDGLTKSMSIINKGLCGLISTSEYGLKSLDSNIAESVCVNEGIGGELIVSADFGCVEWTNDV